jgi:hypothetical protein
MPQIPPYRPDLGELLSSTVSNVIMGKAGWGPDKALAAAAGATAFPGIYRGHLSAVLPNGAFKVFAATVDEIYEMDTAYDWGAGLSASLAVPDGDDLSMRQFGVFMVITNTVDGMFSYNMETPAGFSAVAGSPDARIIFPTNNLLVALDCDANNRRLQTSDFGRFDDWSTGAALGKDLEDGEALTGGSDLGGGRAIVTQQHAVRVMTFGQAGGGAAFRIDKIAEGIGAVHPRSVKGHNGRVFFLHQTGFHMTDGSSVKNIGAEKVNKWFVERCPDLTKVYAEVDPQNTRVRFRYKSADNASETIYADYLDYNWVLDEFIPGSQNTAAIFRAASPGYTLEGLDALGTMETLTFSLDSPAYQGSAPVLGGLDSASKFGFFAGDNLAATLETATEIGAATALVRSATPVTDDTAATVALGVKDRRADAITWGSAVAMQASGRVPLRGRGKMQRYRISHAAAADWTQTQAIEAIETATGGPR